MNYNIVILKTEELTEVQWEQFTSGFNTVFNKNRTVDEMKAIDKRNALGYAYHSFAITEDGVIMGHQGKVPTLYDGNLIFLLGVDTYVLKEYRHIETLFLEMYMPFKKYLLKEKGVIGSIGVPNDNSRPFAIKLFKEKYIADLNYYLLPLRISNILQKSWLKPFDWVWMIMVCLWLGLCSLLTLLFNPKEKVVKYRMNIDENFYGFRFAEDKYAKYIDDKNMYCYTNFEEEGGYTVAYLMDFRENGKRSVKSLLLAVKNIIKQEKVDAIAFIGFLHLCQYILIKLPARFVPKRFTLYYSIYDKKMKYEGIGDKKNWDFSLLNYDVR